jgi:flagellar protein FlaJ
MALNPLGLVPLTVVVALAAAVFLVTVDESWDRAATRYARRLFGRYVSESPDRSRLLRAAFVPQTYRAYASRTYLYVGVASLGGAIVGAYLFGAILLFIPAIVDLLMGLPNDMVAALRIRGFELVLAPNQTLFIVAFGGVFGGITAALGTYVFRWERLKSRAAVRQRNVEEGLPRAVAFMYALSRGGVAFPDALRTFSENDEIYGENAREATVAVREMDLFGRDMITAIRRMAARTPSEEFKTFSENLASVLQSGQRLSAFLRNQYERYQEEAADRQEEILEHLATIAEAYVTVLVAGVLFLITILLVFGLTTTDTLGFIQLLGYVMVPLANVGFMVYLAQKLESLGIAANHTTSVLDSTETRSPDRSVTHDGVPQTDGGVSASSREGLSQLAVYDGFARSRRLLRSPLQTLLWNPARILYVTVPIALLSVLLRAPPAFETSVVNVRLLDDVLVQAALLVLGSFAITRTIYAYRVRRIEAATPEFLERLASLNEAGMTLVESLERLRGSDVGALSPEVERIWADVRMGSNLDDALVRFGRRVRTTSITRVVTLVTNAMRASGSLGPVLRIAATQARADQRLRRRRRQQMLSYLVVIYVSFMVFLIIIVAVQEVLVPALPSHVPTPSAEETSRLGVNADQFARFGSVDKAAYTLAFFHTALVHAVFSGFIGGMLGEGTLRDGAKHAAVLLGVAYVAFLLLSSPVASITMDGPAAGAESVTVESASLSEGGYVVLYLDDRDGPVVGQSAYLGPGTHRNVEIQVDRELPDGHTLVAVAYQDSDGDRALTLGTDADQPYPAPGQSDVVRVPTEIGG